MSFRQFEKNVWLREQNELIRQIYAVNDNTVVVLNGASPVALLWWHDAVVIVQAGLPGRKKRVTFALCTRDFKV